MNCLRRAIEKNNGRPLLGAALYFYDPIFLEIAGHMGFDAVWIEMEHVPISFAQAADLCRMAAGSGMLTMIRIPDTRRESVLKAAECGPDIIDIPMADSPQQLDELVRYSRFAPVGSRGIFGVSRAVKYGLGEDLPAEQQRVNQHLSLLAQIETSTALDRIEQIAAVPEIDIFIGPADLAASLGYPGQTSHPAVLRAAERIISTARRFDKKIVTACAPSDFSHWTRMGVDLLFCANDISCLKHGAQHALAAAQQAIQATAADRAQ
ncbi:MAG: hypothetical protein KGK08_01065 [Acidobacteriota bacterium]|nr:hypothetical protein [Acidobacteriota bacterium]